MSRTDKDRPYWVIMNDRTLGTVEHHDHAAPRYRPYSRVVERGERMLAPYGEYVWIFRHKDGTPGMTIEEDREAFPPRFWPIFGEASYLCRTGIKRWYYERRQRFEWVGRIEEPIEVRECTIDEPYLPWRRYRYYWQPCSVEPYRHNKPHSYYQRPPNGQARKNDERSRRRKVSPAMKRFADEYNTYGEVDDSAWQDFQHRHTPLGGGYWD